MKKEKLLFSMNLIDEQYVEEADPKNTQKPFNLRKFFTIAACFAVVLAGVGIGWMMHLASNPYPAHLAAYADSEYFAIIQKLDAYFAADEEQNSGGKVTQAATADRFLGIPDGTTGSPSQYEEITDNQVEGIIEADLIKRSDKYIYYLTGLTLRIYSIEGEDSKKVGSYTLQVPDADRDRTEFFLSQDCRMVTMIVPGCSQENGADFTQVVSLDVSRPQQILEKGRVRLNYRYNTSRKVDGSVLLLGEYSLHQKPDYSDESTFIPQITTKDGTMSVPMDGIIAPEKLKSAQYTVVCKLSEKDLKLEGSAAFLSYSNGVYVSAQNIFATHYYSDEVTESKVTTATSMSEIACISYNGDSLKPNGSVSIAGWVKDQYSMDEHEGILRVATTTRVSTYERYTIDGEEMVKLTPTKTSASLYCVDLSAWKVVAKVENFAPEGETVRAARFEGDTAYVCTAKALTDPVFFFDLSDLDHITYTDTGTIEGFSTSLISFGDGYLVGIGVGNIMDSVKLEVYQETEESVKSVCSHQIYGAWYSTDYKTYLIDRKNLLIGFSAIKRFYFEKPVDIQYYYLFRYQEGKLIPINQTDLGDPYALTNIRSVYIDGYQYIFTNKQFKVVPVDLTKTQSE